MSSHGTSRGIDALAVGEAAEWYAYSGLAQAASAAVYRIEAKTTKRFETDVRRDVYTVRRIA